MAYFCVFVTEKVCSWFSYQSIVVNVPFHVLQFAIINP